MPDKSEGLAAVDEPRGESKAMAHVQTAGQARLMAIVCQEDLKPFDEQRQESRPRLNHQTVTWIKSNNITPRDPSPAEPPTCLGYIKDVYSPTTRSPTHRLNLVKGQLVSLSLGGHATALSEHLLLLCCPCAPLTFCRRASVLPRSLQSLRSPRSLPGSQPTHTSEQRFASPFTDNHQRGATNHPGQTRYLTRNEQLTCLLIHPCHSPLSQPRGVVCII